MIRWDDWNGAVPVHEVTRSEWAEQAVREVESGSSYCDICSGDSVVIAVRRRDGEITIYDAVIRREGQVPA